MRWGAVGAGAGAVAAAAAAALLCALVVLTPGVQWDALAGRGGGAVRIHSVGYYENLAAADKWEAGPATGAALADDERVRRGRTQLLAQVRARRLGSRGHALVRLCAQGNDQACAQIAGNPRELRALQEAQQRAQLLRQRAPSDQQQEMMAGVKRAARAMANQVSADRMMLMLSRAPCRGWHCRARMRRVPANVPARLTPSVLLPTPRPRIAPGGHGLPGPSGRGQHLGRVALAVGRAWRRGLQPVACSMRPGQRGGVQPHREEQRRLASPADRIEHAWAAH